MRKCICNHCRPATQFSCTGYIQRQTRAQLLLRWPRNVAQREFGGRDVHGSSFCHPNHSPNFRPDPPMCKIVTRALALLRHQQMNFTYASTRGHQYKLFKKPRVSRTRANFFSEHVVNSWNFLPDSVDFSSVPRFKHSINKVDFSQILKCF